MSENTTPEKENLYNISSLDRAIIVLEAFSETRPELTLTEIVGITGLHKATAFRLLASLGKRHLVAKDENTGRYRLGLRMVAFANVAKAHNNLIAEARKVMAALSDDTMQTVYLSVRIGEHRFDIEQHVSGLTETMLSTRLAQPKLLEVGAAGAVMLASTSDQEIEAYLARTSKSRLPSTDVDLLWRNIRRIRKQGYGESKGASGLSAISAPVWGMGDEFLGTISMILPLDKFEQERVAMAQKLVACAHRLSASLGAGL